MDRLKIALVGAGRRGAGAHLPVIAALDDVFELVAICDKDEETVHRLATEHGVKAYTSVRDLVDGEDLDVADVVVPGGAHHAICCFLATAGVHQIVETPIAITRPAADLMIRAASEAGVYLEVAENYYRAPIERLKKQVLISDVIGEISRIYRICHEGGYHGMSLLRILAGGNPTQVIGLNHVTPVVPHTDRMKRRHERESWSLSFLEFDNDVAALMVYSNVIHARSLGRKQAGMDEIDGTAGSIVDGKVYVVPKEELETGAVAQVFEPVREMQVVDDVEVLKEIRYELPGGPISWDNPFAGYRLSEGRVAVADELMSIANAVRENRQPDYGAEPGRLDQEMSLAVNASIEAKRETITFPLPSETDVEMAIHKRFEEQYGCAWDDVEKLVDVFFPRR
ncbi:MAG: Gfo/Idh/MocA family oxidoreductase [bacterium]|nr:Gfo/Idh/MocA family oxidoreductase [bacterium]